MIQKAMHYWIHSVDIAMLTDCVKMVVVELSMLKIMLFMVLKFQCYVEGEVGRGGSMTAHITGPSHG